MLFFTIIVFLPIASLAVARDGNTILWIAMALWMVWRAVTPGWASRRLLAEAAAGGGAPA